MTDININDLKAKLEQKKKQQAAVTSEEPQKKIATVADTKARNFTALIIIAAYALTLIGAWYLFYRHGKTGDWTQASNNMLELIKIGVMPVITLVIGYYFGRANKSD